ncbi:hypothetical protein CJ177_15815 [Rhodococcus sp. ACPA1]|nr:hypothetical protein CJ177_15815 [Rhodococcus sp. ACPA1]
MMEVTHTVPAFECTYCDALTELADGHVESSGRLCCRDCHYSSSFGGWRDGTHLWCPRCRTAKPQGAFDHRPFVHYPVCRDCETAAAARAARRPPTVACAHCSGEFTPARSDARYCSTRCRVAAHRAHRAS